MRKAVLRYILAVAAVTCAHAQEATLRGVSGGPLAPVRALAVSPNGSRLFIGGGFDTVANAPANRPGDGKLYDLATSRLIGTLNGLTKPVFAAAFSPDGKYLVTGGSLLNDSVPGNGELCLWDASNGALIRRYYGCIPVRAVSFTKDGAWIIVRTVRNLTLWQTATGSMIDNIDYGLWSTYTVSPNRVMYAVAYPDTAGSAHVVKTELRSLPNMALLRQFVDTAADVSALAFTPDGLKLANAAGSTIRFRNVETGDLLQTFVQPKANILSMAISGDGAYLAAADATSGSIYVWNLKSGAPVVGADGNTIGVFARHGAPVRSILFLADGRIVTGAEDRTAKIWSFPSGGAMQTFSAPHRQQITSLSFSPLGDRLATVARDSSIIVWNTTDLTPTLRFPTALGAPIQQVQFTPDGNAVAAIANSILYRVSAVDGASTQYGVLTSGTATAISEDCRYVAVGRGAVAGGEPVPSYVMIHNVGPGATILRKLDVQEESVTSLGFARDGSLVVASTKTAVYCWDLPSGKLRWRRTGDGQMIVAVDGGQVIATGFTPTVWDARTGDSLLTIPAAAIGTGPMTLTNDGAYGISVDAGGTLRRWDIASGDTLPDSWLGYPFAAVTVSPDSRLIAAAAKDGTVALWQSGLSLSVAGAPSNAPTAPRGAGRLAATLRPGHGSAVVDYTLPASGEVTLELFNAAGERLRSLVQGEEDAGGHSVTVPSDIPAGIYLVRVTAGGEAASCIGPIAR